MGAGAADIAQVVPSVRDTLGDLPPAYEIDSAQARFRLFDSFTTFFKNIGQQQPLVLILDDLYWADSSSLLLLQFIARELYQAQGLTLIGTYRDVEVDHDHPLSDTLAGLVRESQQFKLSGLSEEEVSQFIVKVTGDSPAVALSQLTTALHQKTNGNPFFVSEILQLLKLDGQLQTYQTQMNTGIPVLPLPDGVRETLRQRLRSVSPACVQLLSTASVLGRTFGLELLVRVHEHDSVFPRSAVLSLLNEALTSALIEDETDSVGHYRFPHALIRETLYEDLPLPERVQLHYKTGEALETLAQPYLEPHLTELADHFLKAVSGGVTHKALHYTTKAGEYATAQLAYEEAAVQYTHVLQILDLQVSDTDHAQTSQSAAQVLRGDILLALGEAQMRAGDMQTGRQTLLQAATLARQFDLQTSQGQDTSKDAPKDAPLLARIALALGGMWVATGTAVHDEELIRLLRATLTIEAEERYPWQSRVLARLAAELRRVAPREERAELSRRAIALARQCDDRATLAAVLTACYWSLWGPENLAERLVMSREIVQLTEAIGDKATALVGRTWYLIARLEQGDMPAVDAEIAAVARLAIELRQPFYQWWASGQPIMRALMDGRLEDVEQQAQLNLMLGQQVEAPDAVQAYGSHISNLYQLQGRIHEFAPALLAFVEQYPQVPAWQCVQAHVHMAMEQTTEARAIFERLAADDFQSLPKDEYWMLSIGSLAEVCIYLNDIPRAAVLYDLLLPYAEQTVVVGPALMCYGSAARVLGTLATLLSQWETAEEHFETAIALNTKMGARPFVAQAQYEYAHMLLTHAQARDHSRVTVLLETAFDTAQQLGLHGQLTYITSLKELSAQRPEAQPVPIASPQEDNLFRREGSYWTLSYAGRIIRLRNAKGLQYLALLLGAPGQEFHVAEMSVAIEKPTI